MTAFLGMYDLPPLRAANDRFWQAIRKRLGGGPDALTRDGDAWDIWTSPELVLAQTCGFPYRARLHGKVGLVGTPDYGLPGCPPGYYRSVLIAHSDIGDLEALASGTFAFNEALSQSGWAAPVHHLAEKGLRPARLLQTGAHAASARAVAEGRADLAGIDALTWALLEEHEPDLTERLVIVGHTTPTPGLPLITAKKNQATTIATAVRAAIEDLGQADRRSLHLHGLADIPAETYLAVPTPDAPALAT